MLSRRNLIAAAIGAGAAARLDGWPPPGIGDHGSSRDDTLAALCLDLGCPHQIGQACLQALPEIERSPRYLARTIFEKTALTGDGWRLLGTLRHAIREQSRADFNGGNVVNVDGWILSLTETRVYALGSLLAKNAESGRSRILD